MTAEEPRDLSLEERRGILDGASAATAPGLAREFGPLLGVALLGAALLVAHGVALASMDAAEASAWSGGAGAWLEVGGGLCLAVGALPLWLSAAGLAAFADRGPLWREPLLAAVAASVPAAIGGVVVHVSRTVGDRAYELVPAAVRLSPHVAATATLAAALWLLVLGLRLRRPISAPEPAPPGSP